MFSNAKNLHITGGLFNMVNTGDVILGPSLEVLHRRVAPNAILNAGGRADEVRCHPGTREEVIGRIETWSDAEDDLMPPVFWLSGPAGAGKSAIAQTIAERCDKRGVPHANFFFFRGDNSRSDASPLIATLLHQIVLLYPSLRHPVETLLSDNPLIFDSTIENQLAKIIVTPLYSVKESLFPYHPLLILIDGLDECDSETKRSQQQILRAFDNVLAQEHGSCPFRLLVASRDESQIRAAFNGMSSPCLQLYLDGQYSPENDIRVFVEAQFQQVKNTHPLAYTLPATWPSVEDIMYVVGKSSGQFIYAATVMRFILDSSSSPKVSLQRVQGAARLATKSPFSHVDAIYTYILTQVDDQEAVKDILHARLLLERISSLNKKLFPDCSPHSSELRRHLMKLLRFYNQRYTDEIILSCLADLTPIAQYAHDNQRLLFYHASFPDYLLDHSRSTNYFVDLTAFNHKILSIVWEHYDPVTSSPFVDRLSILGIFELQELPPGLMNALVSSDCAGLKTCLYRPLFMRKLYKLCITDDDTKNFKHIIWQSIHHGGSYPIKLEDIKDIDYEGLEELLDRTWSGKTKRWVADKFRFIICSTKK